MYKVYKFRLLPNMNQITQFIKPSDVQDLSITIF